MNYTQLFAVNVVHDYYADARCADFALEPTPETRKTLTNYRCVLKTLPNGLSVLIPNGLVLPSGEVFVFRLRLENANFALFTDLSAFASLPAPLFTNKDAATLMMQLGSREAIATESFRVRQPVKTDALTLSGQPRSGTPLTDFFIRGLGAANSQPVGFDETAKILRVNSASAKADDLFTVTYPLTPTLPPNIFADVEITYNANGANIFQAVFTAKKTRWVYYVLTDKNKTVTIEDKDKAIVFAPFTPDATDPIANNLTAQYAGLQLTCFVSNALVPCQQMARKNIQLQMDGEKVVDSLPNPALENFAVNTQKEDVLFHVVKYFTQ